MKKSSGYAVVLPCRVSSLSSCWPSLHIYRQTEIHKLRMKSGLPPQEREAPLARSSFVSTLRHVKSQAKKQSTLLLNRSLPKAFPYSALHFNHLIDRCIHSTLKVKLSKLLTLAKTTATPSVLTL